MWIGLAADDKLDRDEVPEIGADYGQESASRVQLGAMKWVVFLLGSALTVFQLYTAFFGAFVSLVQGAIHVAGAMGLIFLIYPGRKARASRPGVVWYDVLLSAAALFTNFYIVYNYERLTTQAVILGYSRLDQIVAVLGIILILEGTRRCVGVPIVVVAIAAMAYWVLGPYMPVFSHPGMSLQQMATEVYLKSSSIFGIPIQVSSTFIYLFLLFGVVLIKSNIGGFFSDVAFALTGRFTGGTAKTAVVASGLLGTVSGSSVSNTVASGSFTIPMMKRARFRPPFAGATEATASTGGQLVPPIMGAAAFIMAAYTGIPYSQIIILAAVPALLYFTGVFMGTHFEARRAGILGSPREQLPRVGGLLKRSYLFLPLVIIVVALFSGRSPTYAALAGIVTAFALSFLRGDTRMSLRETATLFENGARAALPVIAACATAGIVAGTVTKTGIGGKLAGGVLELAGGSMILVLVFTMLACLILGMGLPTSANYVVTATIAAPILVSNFDVSLIAAHLFVFYFGVVADVTPPVCLAAYAGASIARAPPMRTGVNALKLAIGAFIVPYIFIASPGLLFVDASVAEFAVLFLTAFLGMVAVSGALMGYFVTGANGLERLVLFGAGVMLAAPVTSVSLTGLGLVVAVGAYQYVVSHKRGDASSRV